MSISRPDKRFRAALSLWCAALAGCLAAQPAAAAPAEQVLRIGFILSRTSQIGAGADAFAAEVEKRTGKRYRVETYPDAMLGGEVALMRDVQLGALDLAFVTGAALPFLVPAEGVFNIPYLFKSVRQARDLLDGPIGDEYLSKFDRAGVVALAWGENGLRHLTTANRVVSEPGDLAGLKLRLPQSEAMAAGFAVLGAKVEQIPFNQVYGALQSGRADAEENPIATILASRFANVQTQLILTGHAYDPAVILMSKDAFEALSADDRAAFRKAAKAGGEASRDYATRREAQDLATLRSQGMTVIDSVDRAAFAQRVAKAEPHWEALYGATEIQRLKTFVAAPAVPSTPPVQP